MMRNFSLVPLKSLSMQVPDVVLWLLMCEIVIDLNENGAIYQEQLTTRKLSPENWTAG